MARRDASVTRRLVTRRECDGPGSYFAEAILIELKAHQSVSLEAVSLFMIGPWVATYQHLEELRPRYLDSSVKPESLNFRTLVALGG